MKLPLLFSVLWFLAGCATGEKKPVDPGGEPQPADKKIADALAPIRQRNDTGTAGMVWINGGSFSMGCRECGMNDALPVHPVEVAGFWMDETPVTNAEFVKFVQETGYQTVAEQPLSKEEFPQLPDAERAPGSIVFVPPSAPVDISNPGLWWRFVRGASWRHPEGPGTGIDTRMDHPVVHVCYQDALAYCKWAGKRLPTEAEFEFASRGGVSTAFSWGNELMPQGKWAANIWQGEFPSSNTDGDGFSGTSPVRAFAPNKYGLYDVSGNVWQWCSDWYRADYFALLAASGVKATNPEGPTQSFDPDEPGALKKVQKGGSFLCSDKYCSRYYLGSRGKGEIFSGSSNVGFRCVKSPGQQ